MKFQITRMIACAAMIGAAAMTEAKPFAIIHTEKGDITIELLPKKAPKTVENFIGLAKGTKEWQHPETRQVMKNKPLYDGTKFHRTMKGFMIQGGDPLGNGRGGPGYRFENEDSELTFGKKGVVAMANAGRDTNGSQFFITVAPTPSLNGGYTIFGQVVKGQEVADAISEMPSQPGSGTALNPVTIKNIEIVDSADGGAKGAAKPAASDAKTTGSN